MELNELKILAEKFWNGECSEAEEDRLREYFQYADEKDCQSEYKELREYLSMFNSDSSGLGLDFDQKVLSVVKPKTNQFKKFFMTSAAASVIFLIGFLAFSQLREDPTPGPLTHVEDTYEDPEQALAEVKKALMLVSGKMNKGKKYSVELSKFTTTAGHIQNQD